MHGRMGHNLSCADTYTIMCPCTGMDLLRSAPTPAPRRPGEYTIGAARWDATSVCTQASPLPSAKSVAREQAKGQVRKREL